MINLINNVRQAIAEDKYLQAKKEFMAKYQIPTALFEICTNPQSARQAAKRLFLQGRRAVVKASGLAGGKYIQEHTTDESSLFTAPTPRRVARIGPPPLVH